MLTSYCGRYQAFCMFPGQFQTMGRTYGPDLVIPNIPRQYTFSQTEQHMAQYQQHFLQQQQQHHHQQQHQRLEQNIDEDEDELNSEEGEDQVDQEEELRVSRPRQRNRRSESVEQEHKETSEIKFSIERILSNDIVKTSDKIDERSEVNDDESEMEESLNTETSDAIDEAIRYEWLQCTRYKPPKLQKSKKKESSKKRKLGRNPRVPFTQHQVAGLERKFGHTHYLSSMDVAELSSALNLTETRVKIWFQNRRARERRNSHVKHSGATISELQNDCNFLFAPSSSGHGGVTSRSLTELHEALQHCSAFTPLSFRHNTKET